MSTRVVIRTAAQLGARIRKADLRPAEQVLASIETEHAYVRWIDHPNGRFVGVDGVASIEAGPELILLPGCALAETRAELDTVIEALTRLRDRLPP